jgi:cytochrome P450
LLTRYADCTRVYEDHETFSSDKKIEFAPKYGESLLFEHHTTSLVFNDNPYHGRVRRLIMGAMIPRAIAYMEPALVELVDRLLDNAEEKGVFDAIPEFAGAIPVEIIGNLLAIPGDERGPLRDWSLAILGALEPTLTAAQRERGETAVRDFLAYLRRLLEARRRNPGDPNIDVLTRLIMGDAQGALSEQELLHNCIFLLNAGHETTTNLIGNGLWLLCRFPDERARLVGDPSLMRSAIEEMLRFESSNQLGNRITNRETTIGDLELPARTPVTLCIGAANRDPEAFDDPETFNVSRSPNRHLAFGGGVHQCAGMNLARLEARIALERFLARFPDYEMAGAPSRSGRVRFRGFTSLLLSL